MTKRHPGSLSAAILGAALAAFTVSSLAAPAAAADNDGIIRGRVASANGPEAGVWVIAETDDLETKFRKIVVTDDDGRYLLPELPDADYDIWVRGYGLVDSEPVTGAAERGARPAGGGGGDGPARRRRSIPRNYWLLAHRGAGGARVPRHRPRGQRHQSGHAAARPNGSTT